MKQFVDINHLLCCIRRAGLLTVTERSVRDKDIIGHVRRNLSVVERYLGNLRVRIDLAEKLRLLHILELISIRILFQKVRVGID